MFLPLRCRMFLLPLASSLLCLPAVLASPQLLDLQPLHRNPLNSSHFPEATKESAVLHAEEAVLHVATSAADSGDGTVGEAVESRRQGGNTRIVGGREVSPKYRLGYQAFVKLCHLAKSECYQCGGTVVHQRFVITAAHCLHTQDGTRMSTSNSRVRVVVGEHNICDNVNEGGQVIDASQVYVHPNYGNNDNDMAILQLPRDIIFNSHVRPACLPTSPTASYSGQSVTVSGWGTVRGYDGGQPQPQQPQQCKLKETTLKVQASTNIECRRILRTADSSRLCAFAPRTDSCQGDSGGPLALQQGGRTVLLGVTSYGYGCADSRGVAGIYARVQGFLPWITGIVPGTAACGTLLPAPAAPPGVTGGTVQSPGHPANYPNNQHKTFTLTAAPGKVIEVTFQRLDLERQTTCRYDYVMATDGDGTVLMPKKCGAVAPPSFTSSSNKVSVLFHTDSSVARPGFRLSWREVAPRPGAGPAGVLLSPNYPSSYPNNQDTTYTIPARAGKRIRITFADFNLENHSSCRYDYLKITDGAGSPLFKACGSARPAAVNSRTGSSVRLLFHSDGSVVARGYKIVWTYV